MPERVPQIVKNADNESSLSYYGWIVVATAFLSTMMGYGIPYSFGVFLKPLYSDFGWTRAMTAGAFSAYAISHTVFAVFAGSLTDKWGPRVVAATGGVCLAGSMIMMSSITTLWEFYLYYVFLLGWGVAAAYTPMVTTVSRWFTVKRGLAISLTVTGVGTGSLVLSPLAAWLIESYGWRTAYVVVGAIVFAVFIPIVLFIKKSPRENVKAANEETPNIIQTVDDFSFMHAIKTRSFWALSLSWAFAALALWAVMIHMVPLITDKGIPLTTAGLLAGLTGGGSIVGRILAGFLSDKLGRKQILIAAFTLKTVMVVWLLFSQELWMFFVFAPLFGVSFGGWAGVIPAFPADYFGLKATGSIFGFVLMIAGLGVAGGSFLGGYIFDVTHSYHYMIVMCIVGMLLAIFCALLMKNPRKARP